MRYQLTRLHLGVLMLVAACAVMGQGAAADAASQPGVQGHAGPWLMAQAGSASGASAAQRAAALRAASQALAPAQRNQANDLFATGAELFKSGDFDAARLAFERGLNIDPGNGQARYFLAETLVRLKLNAQAREQYELAQALVPSSAEGLKAEAALARLPGQTLRDCADCPEMVLIPAGRFTMGSPASEAGRDANEEPMHAVEIPQPLAVGKYEVTRGQFARFVSESDYSAGGGCFGWNGAKFELDAFKDWRSPGYPQTDNDPVVCVNWNDAKAYVQWLARKTGKPYRLLSEAEWEYAARAGSQASRPWGDNPDDACRHANVADASARAGVPGSSGWTFHNCSDGRAYTAPVGSYQPNAFGLHDMIGNAWEWTEDCWNEKYVGAPSNGSAWISGDCSRRVLRAASWLNNPQSARSADRAWNTVASRNCINGFRVARTN